MIFVTVGSDIPFDRLVRTVDRWARERDRRDVFAQIGHGGWQPGFIPFSAMLQPAEFRERLISSAIVVGHAGMGTIITALQYSKPILIMPRKEGMGEATNSHQMATARKMSAMNRVEVAFDEGELAAKLDRLEEFQPGERIPTHAQIELILRLNDFIHNRFCE